MKLVREHINEKFTKEGDPIHDMDIGPQGIVYRCGNCGDIIDKYGDTLLDEEELEKAETIIKIFGENGDRVKYSCCNKCIYDDLMRQDEKDRSIAMEREAEARQAWEDEQKWREEQDPDIRWW
jgi:hypothetical protein